MSDGHPTLQGSHVTADDPGRLADAVEQAVDYRGDVTIVRRSADEPVVGYVFDRTAASAVEETQLRVIRGEDGNRVSIPVSDIAALSFSGRDTAAGKSFETWMRKYVEKKLAGEAASIESEELG